MRLFTSIFSHPFSFHHYLKTGSSGGCVNTHALWDIMSKVRDNKRYAIPQIKQIDVTFFPNRVWVCWRSKIKATNWFLITSRQKQKTKKQKQKQKQTNKHTKKRERKHLNLSCNILHDFAFFGIQWWGKNLRKRGRAIVIIHSSFPVSHALGQITWPSLTSWILMPTSSDVTLMRHIYVVFLL